MKILFHFCNILLDVSSILVCSFKSSLCPRVWVDWTLQNKYKIKTNVTLRSYLMRDIFTVIVQVDK